MSPKIAACVLVPAILLATPIACAQDVSVSPYYRRDGSYVQPHHRSEPDRSYNNNWSVSPNSNPYTGRGGTLAPTYNDRTPSQRRSLDEPPRYR